MSRRSRAREMVLQMLFQVDLNPDVGGPEILEQIQERLTDVNLSRFAWQLFTGVMEHRAKLDHRIGQVATNWALNRMAATDRNVLRLGAYELILTDTPPRVVLDEALELAKLFGTSHSSQFVNGVLDKLIPESKRDSARNSERFVPPPVTSVPSLGSMKLSSDEVQLESVEEPEDESDVEDD